MKSPMDRMVRTNGRGRMRDPLAMKTCANRKCGKHVDVRFIFCPHCGSQEFRKA